MINTDKKSSRSRISLNGDWFFMMDQEDCLKAEDINTNDFKDQIKVPGSWEEQGFGQPSKHNPIGAWKKTHEFVGSAWYAQDIFIPEHMKDQTIQLVLSGVRWVTRVYVNDQFTGGGESLVIDHTFDLTDYVKIGQNNKITIYVNNEMRYPLSDSHIHSYHTATNWGGITGGIYIEAYNKTNLKTCHVYPNPDSQTIDVEIELNKMELIKSASFLSIHIYSSEGTLAAEYTEPLSGKSIETFSIPFWDDVVYWDDNIPYLYKISFTLLEADTIIDQQIRHLGIRDIKTDGKKILLNQKPKFLRGYVDCCIFPQTGYPSWDKEHYRKQFITVKEYGFNHVRLHGWTPPKPFWEAADEEGMLVQTELPHWSFFYKNREKEPDQDVHEFLIRELKRVITQLNEHPSFVLFSLGNELISPEGHEALNEMVRLSRTIDPTRLYTDNTGFGRLPAHDREGDFYIPSLNAHPPVNNNYAGTPNTFEDYQVITMQASKPVLAHEHGQFTMYVRPQEAEKYQGVLKPHWLNTTLETLEKKRLLSRVEEFIDASGKLQVIAYKENIERARRTSGLSGIQLLDIRDFPGQGHATTGVLDVFWDSKGTITPDEFRTFNDDAVLLMRSLSRTHYAGEKLRIGIDLSNFSSFDFSNCEVAWQLKAGNQIYQSGKIPILEVQPGHVQSLGTIETVTPADKSQSLALSVQILAGSRVIQNEWEFWSYEKPSLHKNANRIWSDVQLLKNSLFGAKYIGKIGFDGFSYKEEKNIDLAISDHLSTELLQFLLDGGKAWIMANEGNQFDEVKTRFLPIFWNYIWFPSQIGTTMGMIIHAHPSLKDYPHDGSSNWNWFHLVDRATAINLETVPQVKPIVEVIDNHSRGKHLAYSFEVKIGEGKLFVSSFNILQHLKRPEVESLLHQSIDYLMSDQFTPSASLTVGELLGIFKLQGHW
ncbi:glycoside hydrolase family 2 [Bacillus sp. MRMR6]|uniref:glycoside hydrolase family 2 protein n=1 Tax=Bacillus sp. MRMR6 TaxID=1928617 RepID=UPI000951E5D9|nr:glycoside hydrolase family 2 [Bacillus sp. MRMR6]OLS42192.1 hypothetical protein BTR25_02170 [Bacillus sp. MRMR6]